MRWNHFKQVALAALLGAALLLGSPLTGSAEPGKGRGNGNGKGKGWRSEREEKRVERDVERGSRGKGKVFRSVERRVEERRSVKQNSPRRRNEERVVTRTDRQRSARGGESRVTRGARRVQGSGGVREQRVREIRSGERTTAERSYSYRAPSTAKVQTSYRAPRWSGGKYYTGARYHTAYQGYPVYREYVSYRYRPAYAPVYGWRYYCPPRYYYPTSVIYVQPVRFFVAADFVIGGVGISARYSDPGPVYGCNFCDARFGSYYGYETHVEHHCSHVPHGYSVHAADWQDEVWDDGYDDGYQGEWE
jgi:hypothetical protein